MAARGRIDKELDALRARLDALEAAAKPAPAPKNDKQGAKPKDSK